MNKAVEFVRQNLMETRRLECHGLDDAVDVLQVESAAEIPGSDELRVVGRFENEEAIELRYRVVNCDGDCTALLNASEPTNIIYRVKGLTKEKADEINALTGSRKIMARCRAILSNATSIEYEAYHSSVFADNLEVVDSALPKMLADLVKVHYFQQILAPRSPKKTGVFRDADKLSNAVELLSEKEPYASKGRKNFCEIKIKRFLRSCALGLMPSEEWDGKDDASGGYIVVLPDGRLVALYVYNTNLFEKYLFESTIFERASTTRHNYLKLYPAGDSGDYLLKLNLQIRFNR